jgi:hypothetical protein
MQVPGSCPGAVARGNSTGLLGLAGRLVAATDESVQFTVLPTDRSRLLPVLSDVVYVEIVAPRGTRGGTPLRTASAPLATRSLVGERRPRTS